MSERDITITLTEAAKRAIADEGYDPAFGARPLKARHPGADDEGLVVFRVVVTSVGAGG